METNSQPHGLQLRSQPTSVKKPDLMCDYQSKINVEALRLQNQGASSPTPYLRNQLHQKEMFSQDIEQMIQKQRNIQNKADRHKDQELQALKAMEMNQLKYNPRSAKKQIQFENQMSSMTKVFANKSGASLQSKLQIENHGSKFDNENSLKDNLILTALDVITKKVDENITLPKALEQNKYIWSKAFIKNKALQDIINNYTSQITMLMKKELKNNSQYMTDFMKMTRAPDNTLNSAKAFIDASQNREKESGRNRLNKPSTHRGNPSQKLSGPASMSSDQPHGQIKTFETVKTSEGDEIEKAQVKPIISFHEIARSIRTHHAMYLRAKKSFVPEGLDKDLVPTDEWIHELCHGYELQTFFHKKNALEEIKQKIDSEIERRRNVQLMNKNIERITLQFEDLDKQTNFFTNNDSNAGRTPQDFVIQQYKVLCNVDRSKAERLLSPKAPEFMCEWGLETVADHRDTLNKWKDTWQTNQQFEKGIMDEMRWYKMDMLSIERQHRNNISIAKQRSFFYIEALELSLNEQKLKYQKEVNELRMELEDYRSQKLRAFIEDQEDGGNDFIEQYINSKWQYSTVKEANKFNAQLRTEVRNLYQSNKHLKHDFMALRNEHQRAEEKIFKLEDENVAKHQYFDYMTKIVEQGSDPGLPKMYIDSNDDRKKFNIYSKEKLYGSHLKLIEDSKILEKIQGELTQAKVFSIINYGLHEIIQKVGILKSTPEIIKHEGFKKFRFSNEQLLQIYYLFKTPLVRDELYKLLRHKIELQKFGNAFIAGEKDRQANVKVPGETLSTNDPAVRIEERFRKMNQDDMVVLKSQMKEVISAMNIIPEYKAKFLQIQNSNELVYDFNVMVDKESVPLGSAAIDNPEGPRAQLPIIVNNMEIFDTVIITEDRQIIIDNKKFVLFLFDKKNLLDRNKDSQGLVQLWRDVGAFLQSVFSANKLITGVLESTKTYLKEYTPRNLIGREVQVGDSDQTGKVGMDQAQYEELMKMQTQLIESQNKKKNVGKMDKKALEKELQNQYDVIEMLKKQIVELEQELQRKKTASTQKVVVPLHDLDKHQSSIEQSEIFQQDLVELFKGLVIYGKDQNLKKFHKVKDSLSGSDMLNINLMHLGVDSMLQGQNLETIQQRITQITNEDVFGQQTVGEFVMLGLCQTMQDIIMDKQSGGTYLRNRSRQKLQGGPKAENEIQTSIDKDKMQGLLMSNDQLTEIKRENESLQTKVRTILENQCDCMKNSTFRISGQKRVSTTNFIPDEMEKQASQQYSIDMILASAQNMDLNKKSANLDSGKETPIEQDLLLHEIFNEMNIDDILKLQNSELFTPQKKMKAELYNKIRFKLDKFEKVTKTLRQKQLDDVTNNKDESVYAYNQEATKQVINIQENSDARLKTGPAKRKSTGGRNNWNERALTGKLLDFMDFEKYYCLDEGDANNKLLSVRRNVIQKNEEVAQQTFNASNQFVPLSHRTSKHSTQTKVSKRWEYLKSRKRSADVLAQKAARSRQLMNTCQVVFKRMNKNGKKPVLGARKMIEVPEAEFDPAGTYRSSKERLLSKRKTEITINLQSEHQDTDYVCSGQSSPLTPYEKAQGANDNSCILDIIAAEAMGNQQNYVQQNITQQFDDLQDVSKIDMQPSQTMESQYFQNNRNINMQGHLQEQDSSLELQQSGSNREEAKNSTRQRSQNVKVVVYKNASHMKQSMTALEQDLDMVVSPELKQVKETNEGIQSNQVTTYEGRTYGQEMDIRDPAYSGMISGRDDEMRDSQPRYFPGDPMDQVDSNKPEGLQDMELLEQLINESDTNQSSKGKLKSGAADTIIPLSDMEHTDNHGSLPMSNSDRYIDVDQMQEVKTGIKKVRNMIQSAHQRAAPNQRNKIYQLASQNQKKLLMKRNQADQNLSSHVIMGHKFTQQRMDQNQSGNMIEMSCQTNLIEDQPEMVHIPGAMGLMKQKGRATTAVARVGKSLPRPSRMHQGSLATTLQVDVGGYLTTQASKNPREGAATLTSGVQNGQRSNLRYVNFTPSIQSKNPKELGINPRMFQGDHQFLRVGQHKDVQNAEAIISFLKVEGSSEIARSAKNTRNQQPHTQQKYSMSRLDQRKQSVYNDLKNKRKYSTNDRERIKSILKQNDVL